MCRGTSTIRQAVDREPAAPSPAPSLQSDFNTEDHSRSATKLLLKYVTRDADGSHLHSLSSVGSHGVSLDWTKGCPQGIHAVHLRRHHDGSVTSTTGRTADSPDGRPTNHRRLSQDRRGNFSGSPSRRAIGPRRHCRLCTVHCCPSPDCAAEAPCSARCSASADKQALSYVDRTC